MKRRSVCLLLAALLLLQLAPALARAEKNGGGSFVFAAAAAGRVIIPPTRFSYEEGQTIHDVLLNGDHGHTFTEQSSGFINVIDGVEGSFTRVNDRGGYELDEPAASVRAFFFVSSDLLLTEETAGAFSDMLTAMADQNTADNGIRAYTPAQTAYLEAENALLGAPADYARLAENLNAAMEDYAKNVLGAEAHPLALSFETTDGDALTAYTFALSDSYGNRYTYTEADNIIELPAREYRFELTDGQNGANGCLTVLEPADGETASGVLIGGTVTEKLCVHSGESWIGDVILHGESGGDTVSDAFPSEGNTCFVPDTASAVYIWLGKGAGLDGTTYTTSNVKVFPVYCRTDGLQKTGAEASEKRTWLSRYDALTKAIERGSDGNTVTLEARCEYEGYTLTERREISILRTPTLSALEVRADGAAQELGFSPLTADYALTVNTDTLTIRPAVWSDAYTVTVNGKTVRAGESAEVPLTEEKTEIPVAVTVNGQTKTYSLTVTKVGSVDVTVRHDSDVSVRILNAAGAEMGAKTEDIYALVPGESYTCVSTIDEYYHAELAFTASAGLTVAAARPATENWLTALALRSGVKAKTAQIYLDSADFRPETHEYTVSVPDTQSNLYAAAVPVQGERITAQEAGITVSAVTAEKVDTAATAIRNFLQKGPEGQTLTIRASGTGQNGETLYQDYRVSFRRSLSLTDLTLTVDGEAQPLYAEGTTWPGYDSEYDTYTADLVRAAQTAELHISLPGASYYTLVNGGRWNLPTDDSGAKASALTVPLTLDYALDEERIAVQVCCDAEGAVPQTVTVKLRKRDAVRTTIRMTDAESGKPVENGLAVVYDRLSGERIWPEADGTFPLVDTLAYRVVCTAYGYAGQERSITAGADGTELPVTMYAAPEQTVRPELASSWPSFRGSDDANGVVNFRTPTEPGNAMLSWASKLGEGYSSAAVSCPILITEDGYEYLIVYASEHLYKVDALSGVTVAIGNMDHSSSFAINSPTYAEGMIFVGLANGTIQAFDAETLESLWIYRDPRGGQPNCPITYSDGYIYTGFWNSETTPANFVCLSVTDEDPTQQKEEKLAAWTHTDKGFYWAGCYVDPDGQFLLVGTDDGDPGYLEYTARLICLDPATGELLDAIDGIRGDLRSNVSYDAVTDRYYFTSKGGYFYSTKMTTGADGRPAFDTAAYRAVCLDNGGNDPGRPPMSTCTPVIYGSRAYIGVSGVGQFTAYSGHNITVIDLNTWKIAYSVPTQGYPQTSGLLTTAYEEETGYVYVYFFDNFTPGKLRVLQDRAGQTKPVVTTPETFTDKGKTMRYDTPYVLFTPSGEQEQYAICSPISDSFGTIYFKNDSAYLMALSNTITGMKVVKQPDQTEYQEGEHFDGTGMEIEITFSNGMKRTLPVSRTVNGITIRYFTWDDRKDGLRGTDSEFFIRYCACLYQDDVDETGVVTSGKPVASPEAALSLTVAAPEYVLGDVDGNGNINNADIQLVQDYLLENVEELSEAQFKAADVDRNGKVNNRDVQWMQDYMLENIASFDEAVSE